ncbi:hypothetical protein T484DRAFT_1798959 [Baffinella frigidus]|nr:hypothetical protein T484DRAFT_1798959 [Cryptophyta sp. CCMP2293]
MSGEEQQDRKRKGSEPDATVVAPKKKFLAARAEAAAQDGAGGGGKGDRQTTSYSIKDNAPSGALNAESEEIIKFQNKQLYAAIEAKKLELARREKVISTLEASEASHKEAVACVLRHWCMLTEELKSTMVRLTKTTASSAPLGAHKDMLESILALEDVVPEGMEAALGHSCKVAREVMAEVVEALQEVNAQHSSMLSSAEAAAPDENAKAALSAARQRAVDAEEKLDTMQTAHRQFVLDEGRLADDAKAKASQVEPLVAQLAEVRQQLERADARLVRSEEAFRTIKDAKPGDSAVSANL